MSNAEKQSADKHLDERPRVEKAGADEKQSAVEKQSAFEKHNNVEKHSSVEKRRTEIPVTILQKEIACPNCNLTIEVPPGGLLSRFCARCNSELPETDNCGSSCFSCLKAVGASSTPCHEGEAESPLNSKKSSLNVVQRLWDYVIRRSSP